MSRHALRRTTTSGARPHRRSRRMDSVRVRALLCLGLLAAPFVTGTYAYWTDEVVIQGTTLTTGTLSVNVNEDDPHTTAQLSLSNMVPGSSTAATFVVNNDGTVPAKYTVTGGLIGGDSEALAGSLELSVYSGGSVTNDGTQQQTCSGSEILPSPTLTITTSTPILAKRPASPIAVAASETLCFEITLAATAPSTLQGKTTNVVFTVTGTSDVS